jgi:hypothetical protein
MELSKQNVTVLSKRILPAILGATAGYAYYYFIGCVSGTCPITSNPWMSTGYGALLGLMLTPSLSTILKKKREME